MICPNCNANLEGDLIYSTFLEKYGDEQEALRAAEMYGATKTEGRWGREIAIYDMYKDRTVAFRCPDCGYECERNRRQASHLTAGLGGILKGRKMSEDPWKHRSSSMKCKTCMWFVVKDIAPNTRELDDRGMLGRCRRHAPTMNGYPACFEADWCGDHKMDESRL